MSDIPSNPHHVSPNSSPFVSAVVSEPEENGTLRELDAGQNIANSVNTAGPNSTSASLGLTQVDSSPEPTANKSGVSSYITGANNAGIYTTLPHPRAPANDPTPGTPVTGAPHRVNWDTIIANFLREAGLTQALRGFESDMIILNPDWERRNVHKALHQLVEGLTGSPTASQNKGETQIEMVKAEDSLDERKLEHAHFAPGVEPRTPSTVTQSISRFLAQNRARNDASNRQEFLLSLSEKRRRLNESGDYEGVVASCARTDAKTQNRDLQMKFDIAKNEDGPLRKTLAANAKMERTSEDKATSAGRQIQGGNIEGEDKATSERYPGLDERLKNIEEHIAVRYVPSPPRSLLDRLKFIEDHLVHLEAEYPPWAALHFNQPRRGWPPPPRPTPIIVPSHLTSSAPHPSSLAPATGNAAISVSPSESVPGTPPGLSAKVRGKQAAKRDQSSLHRAVMERLEVQRAMDDLAGKQ